MNWKFILGGLATAMGTAAMARIPADYVEGEVIVKFRPGMTIAREAAIRAMGATVKRENLAIGTTRLRLPSSLTTQRAVAYLQTLSSIEYAEPNYTVRALAVPNDTDYNSRQWAPQMMQCPAAWDLNQGSSGTIIAIIDTGVNLTHPDLQSKVTAGYDFANDDNDPTDDNSHGSHCAGIAAAATNNGVGMAGVGWNCRVMPIKVLSGGGGGSFDDVAAGITYAADNGAQILSLSLGGYGQQQAVEDACRYAWNRGCVILAAAGNDNTDQKMYPAGYDAYVIAVGSTNRQDSKSGFSNYGATWVDVAAPGGTGVGSSFQNEIYSTVLGTGYASYFGTSMACPNAAGVAGLVHSALGPGATNTQIRNILESTTDPVGNWVAKGRINALKAVQLATQNSQPPVVVAPRNVQMTMGTSATGGAADLGTANNLYYTVNSQSHTLGQISEFQASYIVPNGNVISLSVELEASAASGATAMVYLWNYNTSTWTLLKTMPMQSYETLTSLRLSSNLFSRYVSGGQMQVRLRTLVPYRRSSVGPRPSPQPFPLKVDMLGIAIRVN